MAAVVIWDNRRLIASMVRRDILSRYRGSFAGALWTFINPLLLMLTYFFVFGLVLDSKFSGDPSKFGFVLYLLAGLLPWWAFSEAVARAPHVMLEHRNFVKKLRFPLETLPVNLAVSGLVTESIGVSIFLVALLVARHAVPLTALWLPVLLLPQVFFTIALCWFLAALGVYMRDLSQIMSFVVNLWFWLTPICYEDSKLPQLAVRVLRWNPLCTLVRAYRTVLLENQPPPIKSLAILLVGSLILAWLGYAWFQRLRRRFADVI